ncbi:TonB-dependent siderophore receptor [Enterovirga rhinocerotis]|uniref:Iron complex outermembrane receptor protein n=1 Tax=Enterovirga rhinocerotis TaxID=1339210 RepID=A0A4V3DWL1_9HYPH|nr:TonB-dependent siderophore receptor [Enterovirga rhinocerotis]TDR85169.1 iron complex outermembrane receptor protein [Enterovirga rhinocerotis]
MARSTPNHRPSRASRIVLHLCLLQFGTALGTCFAGAALAQSTLPPVDIEPPAQRRAAPVARPAPAARAAAAPRRQAARRASPARAVPRQAAAPAPASTAAPLERGDGPVPGFVASRTTSGTKTDTPLMETPQAVTVISADQINTQKARSISEAIRYAPGVKSEPFGNDTRNDWFNLRGFQAEQRGLYLDNLQLFSTAFATFKLEPFGMERIEVLRGPSAVLYGGGNPGGLINAISKKPLSTPSNYVETGVDNFGRVYGAFDFTGPVRPQDWKIGDGEFYYRMVGLAGAGGTQTAHTSNDRYYIAPSFTWKPNEGTTLTVLGSFTQDYTNGQNFLPYKGSVIPAEFGKIPTRTFTSDRGLDRFNRTQAFLGYELEHKFDDIFTFRQNVRYSYLDIDFRTVYGFGANPAGDLTRINFETRPRVNMFNVDNNVEAKFNTGLLSHTTLLGLDYRRYNLADNQGTIFPGTPFNLITGIGLPNPRVPKTNRYISGRYVQDQLGVYLQDQIKFDRFTLVLSGRYDMVDTDSKDFLTPVNSVKGQEGRFSGRAGLIYTSEWGIAPYVSYSNSFNPQVGVYNPDARRGVDLGNRLPLRSEKGEQYEAGVKWQPQGFNGHIGIAAFDLRRQNAVTTGFPLIASQAGEVRSKGIEFEVVANPFPGLNIVGSYTTFDIEVTRDELKPETVGRVPVRTPQQFGGIFFDYTFQDGPLAGFGFGGGVRYVGRSYATETNYNAVNLLEGARVPAYTLGDAQVHYERNGWRFAVNMTNITDEKYVGGCADLTSCYYGERRRVTGSISYRW